MSSLGELLRTARLRAGLTQEELGDLVDVTDGYICKLEKGDATAPSRKVALKLVHALGLSDPEARNTFLLAAGVLSEEDVQGVRLESEGKEDAPAAAGAWGAGHGLGPRLARASTGQQPTAPAAHPGDHTLQVLVAQIAAERQYTLTPEQRRLAARLIGENARAVCAVLATAPEQQRR